MPYQKSDAMGLPPGQHEVSEFPRFGLPRFARRIPNLRTSPEIKVTSEVGRSTTISLEELTCLPRREQEADFHCVTTWTVRRLRWSGYALRDFIHLITERIGPFDELSWVGLRGLDGYVASLPVEFATDPDVLLADRLFGEPLDLSHGAPLRVLAPSHYGYKSVKHLAEIHLLRSRPRGSPGWKEHPVALVAKEERTQHIPGWLVRWLFRPFASPLAWYYRRNTSL